MPSASVGEGHTAATSFISLEKPPPLLPGTFSAYGSNFHMKSEGVVEYAIHARLNYIHRRAHKVLYATSPITLRHPIDSNVCLDKSIKYLNYYPMKIQSHRLLPGMENAKLSLGQKTHKPFHSSKVPAFWYELAMEIPTAIQLCRQNPFPLSFSFIHREDKSSDNIKHHPQKIEVNWVKLHLHYITAVMAPSNLRTNYAQKDQTTNEMNLHLEKLFDNLESPLVINSTGKRDGPINLGNIFQLNLRYDGLYVADRRLVYVPSINPISADFKTYGIKHSMFDTRMVPMHE